MPVVALNLWFWLCDFGGEEDKNSSSGAAICNKMTIFTLHHRHVTFQRLVKDDHTCIDLTVQRDVVNLDARVINQHHNTFEQNASYKSIYTSNVSIYLKMGEDRTRTFVIGWWNRWYWWVWASYRWFRHHNIVVGTAHTPVAFLARRYRLHWWVGTEAPKSNSSESKDWAQKS